MSEYKNTVEVDKYWLEDFKYKHEKLCRDYDNLKEEYNKLQEKDRHNEFIIETELEPRVKTEKKSYDLWVLNDTGAEQCESFEYFLEEIITLIEDNPLHFDWGDSEGTLSEQVLSTILKYRETHKE